MKRLLALLFTFAALAVVAQVNPLGRFQPAHASVSVDADHLAVLENGWTIYAGGASPYSPPTFYKDSAGTVHISGAMANYAAPIAALDVAAFTLPPGYRPFYGHSFRVIVWGGEGELYVHTDGTVKMINAVSETSSWPQRVMLSGISFRASP